MAIIKYTDNERNLLARIMRSEAIGEGNLGMLMVGDVVVNRVLADCLTFKNIRSINDAIYQPNQFSGINNSLFYGNPTTAEKNLADRIIKGEYYFPATNALWFYSPKSGVACQSTWYNQSLAGKYKSHCFYNPAVGTCREIR